MFSELLLNFIAKTYRDAAHSVFAPSASERWMTCPGSLIPNLLSSDTAGIDAAIGTVAHELHEEWLKSEKKPRKRVGEIVNVNNFDVEITDDMLEYVGESVERLIFLPGKHLVEQRVDFSPVTPIDKQSGTSDFMTLQKHKLDITDYKHGKGVKVFAENNSQGLLYALGAFFQHDKKYNFQEIRIRIHQPRIEHFDEWELTRSELLQFSKKVEKTAKDAWRLDAPFVTSEKGCRFCSIKSSCVAYLQIAEDIVDECFSELNNPTSTSSIKPLLEEVDVGLFDPTLPQPVMLTTRQQELVLPMRGMFEAWFSAIANNLEQRALDGEKLKYWKLVESRSNRVIPSEDKFVKRMEDAGIHWTDLYKLLLITPPQAEVLLHSSGMRKSDTTKYLSSVVRKPPGKPTLVPVSDNRPEWVSQTEDIFADLSDDI